MKTPFLIRRYGEPGAAGQIRDGRKRAISPVNCLVCEKKRIFRRRVIDSGRGSFRSRAGGGERVSGHQHLRLVGIDLREVEAGRESNRLARVQQ